ncbi:hypothetical protein KIL84_014237 [Mauremys mutica]|uniref:C2 domain-containing protein n=1 Tax=Mauremys mutica TaxID=74926 RepID=A0A9D3XQB9_9SAUR|nr:hypothetical protein KIL84_014237 [Mauremys mutica]
MAASPVEVVGLPSEEENTRIVRVKIIAGIGLAKKDILGASDPYVKVTVYEPVNGIFTSVQTKTIKKSYIGKVSREKCRKMCLLSIGSGKYWVSIGIGEEAEKQKLLGPVDQIWICTGRSFRKNQSNASFALTVANISDIQELCIKKTSYHSVVNQAIVDQKSFHYHKLPEGNIETRLAVCVCAVAELSLTVVGNQVLCK